MPSGANAQRDGREARGALRRRVRGGVRRFGLMNGICSKCKQRPRRVFSTGTLSSWCVECDREADRASYLRNRDKVRQAQSAY